MLVVKFSSRISFLYFVRSIISGGFFNFRKNAWGRELRVSWCPCRAGCAGRAGRAGVAGLSRMRPGAPGDRRLGRASTIDSAINKHSFKLFTLSLPWQRCDRPSLNYKRIDWLHGLGDADNSSVIDITKALTVSGASSRRRGFLTPRIFLLLAVIT